MSSSPSGQSAAPRRLFIHSLPSQLFGPVLAQSALVGLSKRALALAEPRDAVVLESDADPAYLSYLRSMNRGPDRIIVPSPGQGTLAERLLADEAALSVLEQEPWTLEPYFAGEHEQLLAQRLNAELHGSTSDIAERVNHKTLLSELLSGAGLPDVETTLAPAETLLATVERALQRGPLIVRADVGIGGSGVFVLRQQEDLETLAEGLAPYAAKSLFLVQPFLQTRSSPNVQYDLTGDGAHLIGASEQRLRDGIHHVGNASPFEDPCRAEVLRQGQLLAEHAATLDYRGYLGIDFIITTSNEVFVIELNPRLNTSSFGWLALGRDASPALLCLSSIPAPDIEGFEELHSLLPEEAWIGAGRNLGILPILPPSQERPRVDLVVAGPSKADAEERSKVLLERLQAVRSASATGESR